MKRQAKAIKEVPAILSPTRAALPVGTVIDYLQERFWNGESHYILANKTTVPSIFFDDLEEVTP